MTQFIVPTLILVLAVFGCYKIIIQGEVQDSLRDFVRWSWLRIRKIRVVFNYPFREFLHESTRDTPFALGQTWVGIKTRFTIIGWANDKSWVIEFRDGHKLIFTSAMLREFVADFGAYLYEMDEELDYHPKSTVLHGANVVVMERA